MWNDALFAYLHFAAIFGLVWFGPPQPADQAAHQKHDLPVGLVIAANDGLFHILIPPLTEVAGIGIA